MSDPESVVEYQPPTSLGDDWIVDAEHATIGMDVAAAGREGSLASIWLRDNEPVRADVLTDDGLLNVAWDRLEVAGR